MYFFSTIARDFSLHSTGVIDRYIRNEAQQRDKNETMKRMRAKRKELAMKRREMRHDGNMKGDGMVAANQMKAEMIPFPMFPPMVTLQPPPPQQPISAGYSTTTLSAVPTSPSPFMSCKD